MKYCGIMWQEWSLVVVKLVISREQHYRFDLIENSCGGNVLLWNHWTTYLHYNCDSDN